MADSGEGEKLEIIFTWWHVNIIPDDAQRYRCANCHCDITMRLKCAQCSDIDLCLEVRVLVLWCIVYVHGAMNLNNSVYVRVTNNYFAVFCCWS